MAYTAGQLIEDIHYNEFVSTGSNSVNAVWGTGIGDKGYGQTNTLGTVSDGQLVTAAQWSTMLQRMTSMSTHQNTTITSTSLPTTGDVITIVNNLNTDLTSLTTNRTNNNGFTTITPNPDGASGTGTASWTTSTIHTFTVTFAGGNEARHFFNCGGMIQISPGLTPGGTPNAKETEWVDLLATKVDTVTISANDVTMSGSGVIDVAGAGYFGLTSSVNQNIFRVYADTAPYTTNFFQINCNPGAAHSDALGNVGNVLTFEVIMTDNAAEDDDDLGTPGIQPVLDTIDGTTVSDVTLITPTTANLNNAAWGTVTCAEVSFVQT